MCDNFALFRAKMQNIRGCIQAHINALRTILKKPLPIGLSGIVAVHKAQNLGVGDAFAGTARLCIAQWMQAPGSPS